MTRRPLLQANSLRPQSINQVCSQHANILSSIATWLRRVAAYLCPGASNRSKARQSIRQPFFLTHNTSLIRCTGSKDPWHYHSSSSGSGSTRSSGATMKLATYWTPGPLILDWNLELLAMIPTSANSLSMCGSQLVLLRGL